MWDLYNEPGNSGMGNRSLPLVEATFAWAREAKSARPRPARAQVAVEVSPLRVEMNAGTGGAPYTQAVTLTNRDKNAVRIRARVDDWYLSKDGTPQYVPAEATMPYSAAAWTRVNPSEQVAQPGETVTVRFTTTTPSGTTPGGYRAAIMFEFGPPGGDAAGQGTPVILKAGGQAGVDAPLGPIADDSHARKMARRSPLARASGKPSPDLRR